MKKLRSNRGETLVEVMASILISALSVALLFSCVAASFDMDKEAKELDKKHYEALTAAETYTEGAEVGGEREYPRQTGTVTITNEAITDPFDSTKKLSAGVPVEIYGGARMYAYKRLG